MLETALFIGCASTYIFGLGFLAGASDKGTAVSRVLFLLFAPIVLIGILLIFIFKSFIGIVKGGKK